MSEEKIMNPVHPGEILAGEFMEPLGITAYRLAKDLDVTPPRIYEILKGERAISAGTALRLGRYFGIDPQFWINLQTHYDLEVAKDREGERIEREVRPLEAATACRTPDERR